MGRRQGIPPHPLFDPVYYKAGRAKTIGDNDPLTFFLSRRSRLLESPHPLFDATFYLAANPAASKHPQGPLGHYVATGAAAGLAPNSWYEPDPEKQPEGLAGWVKDRRDEWLRRQDAVPGLSETLPPERAEAVLRDHEGFLPARRAAGEPLVSVVLVVGDDLSSLRAMVESVRAQTVSDWEAWLLHDDDPPNLFAVLDGLERDERIHLLRRETPGRTAALNLGLSAARGSHVAWLSGGDTWAPDHLRLALAVLAGDDAEAAYDVVETSSPEAEGRRTFAAAEATPEQLAAGRRVDLSALVVSRALAVEVGGFDETLPGAAGHDFLLAVAERTALRFVPVVGVHADPARRARDRGTLPPREQPALDHATLESWHDVVLNRRLVDWGTLASRASVEGTVSVIIPTYDDHLMTSEAVRCVAEAAHVSDSTVETIVVNNGSGLPTSVVLDSLPLRFPGVKVVSLAVNHGFALGNNLALEHATGDVVVFLNNDTEVGLGWLDPLMDALADPDVLGAQSLLVYPSGSIQSAGVAFPSCGGVPHVLLQGFPVEDAADLRTQRFSALTAAALAMRFSDVVALRGFDPVYRNGMEDVDLGLRMRALRPGRFVVEPRSVVLHHESRSPGRFANKATNRRLLMDRWADRMPGDDVELWRHVGFDVLRHEVRQLVASDPRVSVPEPVLARAARAAVAERPPSLRWAIKNPAPAGPLSEIWGDTHFARRLAIALRNLGQQVVIDHRPEFDRSTGQLDDVVLVLRGVAPYRPLYGQVNLAWLISHPDMLHRAEAASYDRVLAASVSWSQRMSREWGLRIDPLLQATDATLFHPDRGRPDTGHPVVFVGGSRKQRRPIVRDAVSAGLPLSVYGPQWEGLIPDRYVKAQQLPNHELAATYRSAGVVLNDHWEDMRVAGFLSNRLFDAAAAGARVVTDDVAGLEGLFGRSVQVARDAAELARLAASPDLDAVFGDDAERREVASRVHAEHTFDVRARQLVDVALEVRGGLSASRRDAREASWALG